MISSSVRIQRKAGENRKTVYKTVNGGHKEVLRILQDITPFLIIKQKKAEDAINSILSRKWGTWNEEAKIARGLQTKLQWKNPTTRNKFMEAARTKWNNPETKQKQKTSLRLAFQKMTKEELSARAYKIWESRRRNL